MKITRLEFRKRFTVEEKRVIYGAATTSVDLKIYLDELAMAEFVDTDDASTIAGIQMLETVGIIAPGRANEILNGVTVTSTLGGFTQGQQVRLLGVWGQLFPGQHEILGFDGPAAMLAVGNFDISNIGAA